MPAPTAVTAVIVRNMQELRQQHGWSARELAERLTAAGYATTREVIANQESGRARGIAVDQLVALSRVFAVPLEELVKDLERPCPTCQGVPPRGFQCRTCGAVIS